MSSSLEQVRRVASLVGHFDGTKAQTRALLLEARRFRRAGLWEESDVTVDFLILRLAAFRTQNRLALRLARVAVRTCPDQLHLLLLARVLEVVGRTSESRTARLAASEAPNLHPPPFPGFDLDANEPT